MMDGDDSDNGVVMVMVVVLLSNMLSSLTCAIVESETKHCLYILCDYWTAGIVSHSNQQPQDDIDARTTTTNQHQHH